MARTGGSGPKGLYIVRAEVELQVEMLEDVQRVLAAQLFATHELDVWWPAGEYAPPAGQAREVKCYLQQRTSVLSMVGKVWLEQFAQWKAREVGRVTACMWGWFVPRAVAMCTVRGYRPERVVAWAPGGLFVPKRTELRVELVVQEVAVVSGVFVRKGRMRAHRLKAQVYAGPASSRWWRSETPADAWERGLESEERAEAVVAWKQELEEELGAWCRAQSAVLVG